MYAATLGRCFPSRPQQRTPTKISPSSWKTLPRRSTSTATAAATSSLKPFTEIPGFRSIEEFMAAGGPQKMLDVAFNAHKKFGDISYHNLFGFNEVTVYRPEDIQKVAAAEGKWPSGIGLFLPVLGEFMASRKKAPSILMLQNEEWKRVRTALQKKLFAPSDAESYLPVLNSVSADASKLALQHSHEFHEFFPRVSFELVGAVLFNRRLHGFGDSSPETKKYFEEGLLAFDLLEKVMHWNGEPDPKVKERLFQAMDYVYQTGGDFIMDTLNKAKETGDESSYLSQVARRTDLTFDEILTNVAGFLFAGVDTTSLAIQWLIYNFARTPETQRTLQKELKEVLGGRDLEAKDIPKLEYLRNSIKESFRLSPTASGTLRILQQPIDIQGYEIPAGTCIMMQPYPIGMSPEIFENPTTFDPSRWSKEKKLKRAESGNTVHDHTLTVMPFGRGPRMCIGSRVAEMEIFSLLTRFFQDYSVEVEPSTPPYEYRSLLTNKVWNKPKYILTPRK